MTSRRLMALASIPVAAGAALALSSTASAQASCDHCFVQAPDGAAVTVPVRWDARTSALPARAGDLHITLTGTTRAGRRVRFAHVQLRDDARNGGTVRLVIPPSLRGQYRSATDVVATEVQQHDSTGDANRTPDRSVVTLLARRDGAQGANALSGARLRDCTGLALKAGTDARNCDLHGAHLADMDLRGVRLQGANLQGANLSRANLSRTGLAGADLRGARTTGSTPAAAEQQAISLPSGGSQIIKAIDGATTSVDIVMYDFGGPNVVGQVTPGKEGALVRAAERGVNVRVILNSAGTNSLCAKVPDPTGACAWQTSKDFAYAMQSQLQQAAAIAHGKGFDNTVRVQFSSENFNITHQKTVLIDAFDAKGNLLPAPTATNPWPATTQAIVSSGNLQAFPSFWGQRIVSWCPSGRQVPNTETCAKWTAANGKSYPFSQSAIINENYQDDPMASCVNAAAMVPGAPANCGSEWAPRDFAIQVTTPAIIARIAAVFASDARCDGRTVDNVFPATPATGAGVIAPPGLMGSGQSTPAYLWPETWSNGSTMQGADGTWSYPDPNAGGYFAPGYPQMNLRGNVRDRQLALIASARHTLQVYNEEMSDWTIVGALQAAAKSGVTVQIAMANDFMKTAAGAIVPDRSQTSWSQQFDQLAATPNVSIHVLDETGQFRPKDLYIHAKAIVADGTDGWVGSINASQPSMNDNRELGLGFTVRQATSGAAIPAVLSTSAMTAITTAFASDFASGVDWKQAQASTATPVVITPAPAAPTVSAFGTQEACIPASAEPAAGLPVRNGDAPQPVQSPAAG